MNKNKIAGGKKITKKRTPSTKTLVRMIIEWEQERRKTGTYENWWRKYPSFSRSDVIRLLERKLKLPQSGV